MSVLDSRISINWESDVLLRLTYENHPLGSETQKRVIPILVWYDSKIVMSAGWLATLRVQKR